MSEKTYRAIRHDIVRHRQRTESADTRHPDEKKDMIECALKGKSDLRILDLFAGTGNCTKIYSQFGSVLANDKVGKVYEQLLENTKELDSVECVRKDSFTYFHELISQKKKFDVIDIDPYGFPNRFFPDIYLLIDDGYLFVTMPKPYVNILNGITQAHLISYYDNHNPTEEHIIERLALWGICHWREVTLIDSQDLKSVWRFCFRVKKVKATEYTGVRNR
jgi:tRNA G26 N,N-dimethylase Trm1|tara:strand:+ start:1966 stop:2625 length:660 start_codon:yes stop_codon:yes gene_type:complete